MRLSSDFKAGENNSSVSHGDLYVLGIPGILNFISMQILRLGPFVVPFFFFLIVVTATTNLKEVIIFHVSHDNTDIHDIYLPLIKKSS